MHTKYIELNPYHNDGRGSNCLSVKIFHLEDLIERAVDLADLSSIYLVQARGFLIGTHWKIRQLMMEQDFKQYNRCYSIKEIITGEVIVWVENVEEQVREIEREINAYLDSVIKDIKGG